MPSEMYRRCVICGEMYPFGGYRAHALDEHASFRVAHGTKLPCHVCGGSYTAGDYRSHMNAPEHRAARQDRAERHRRALLRGRRDDADRNAAIVAAVVGPPRRTMESVAAEYGVTRQRVQQILLTASIRVADLPPLPRPPRKPRPAKTCRICGQSYPYGQYEAHVIAAGHVRNRGTPGAETLERGKLAAALIDSGLTWEQAAARLGISKASLAAPLRQIGRQGYGWMPAKAARNVEIVHRYVDLHQSTKQIAAEMGLSHPNTVHNVMRMVRAVGLEGALPHRRGRRPDIADPGRNRRLRALYPEIDRRLAAKEKPMDIARALGIKHGAIYNRRSKQR